MSEPSICITKPIIVSTLGARGGSGKSTLAHLLALGAAQAGRPVVLFETDKSRPSLAALDKSEKRPYLVVDAIDREDPDNFSYVAAVLQNYIDKFAHEGAAFIIDGAAARNDFDAWVAKSSNLVLVSAMATDHDMLCLKQSWPLFSRNKNAHIVLTRTFLIKGWIEDRQEFVDGFPVKPTFRIPQHEFFSHLTDSVYRHVPGAAGSARAVWKHAELLAKY